MNILILMACLSAGILIGRSGRLPPIVTDSMDRVLMIVIYALLLFVGIEVGTYSEVLQNLGTIGAKSVILCLGSITGSGLLCMFVMGRGWSMFLMPVLVLSAGILAGLYDLVPAGFIESTDTMIKATVMLICFVIGLDMGKDRTLWKNIHSMGWKAFMIPVTASIGAVLGGIAAGKLTGIPLSISTASAVGGGYYSLATILVKDLAGPEAATIAFISNILRELTVITSMPLLVKLFGRWGSVAVAGATAMDTSLPFIVKNAGRDMAIAAFVSGVILTVTMPVLIPLCYRIF